MSAQPLDYLAAAVLIQLRQEGGVRFGDLDDVSEFIERSYGETISTTLALHIIKRLEQDGLLTLVHDRYAGTFIRPTVTAIVQMRLDALRKSDADSPFPYLLQGGGDLITRALKSSAYWADLDGQIEKLETETDPADAVANPEVSEIPASDRVVTVSHNQFAAIDEPLTELERNLEADNGDPDKLGLRERILGHLRAGRELLRSGFVELNALHFTMIVGLKLLIDQYKGHALAVAAQALLTIVFHEFGLPGY